MADVLEHMPLPKSGLAAAHRLLRPEGVLFLSMANIDKMVWWRLHAKWRQSLLGRDRALPQFFPQAALRAPANHGFRPVEYHISERYRLCMEVVAVKQR
jgi:protein O-GlcNAc transferase